eukprot:TRINITY_DN10428_c0_g1_i2.p2 TRINITY_DN10428_c0_g1~~TRINITY_DN10428_c0_g1_i2.p2  ORF type:complete len:201 (-),score=76.13 TRINITY_DN10428_c0_g1_i2:88-615(-)
MALMLKSLFVLLLSEAFAQEDDAPVIPQVQVTEDLTLPGILGMREIADVVKLWAEDGREQKEKCQKIFDGLTVAADAEHDIFNGVRLFATLCKKGLDAEGDEQTKLLDQALSKQSFLIKAVKRVETKVRQHAEKMEAMVKAQKEQQAQQAAKAAADAEAAVDEEDLEDEEEDDEF